MFYFILLLLLLAIIIGPQFWVTRVLIKYNKPSDDIDGTGAQFAKHLLKKLNLAKSVTVEETTTGDHYDPQTRTVRLNTAHYNQRSIAAMVIATHEVGHAIQHAENNAWFNKRQRLAVTTQVIEKIAPMALVAAPILLLISKSPISLVLMLVIGLVSVGSSTATHLMTLPVELDASFNKAMPILKEGGYFKTKKELRIANKILQAAAMTYVAQSLHNLLNVSYWLRAFQR